MSQANVRTDGECPGAGTKVLSDTAVEVQEQAGTRPSRLRQWPIQLRLVNPMAPYFRNADVLLVADCVAYALGDFHKDHLTGHSLAIACPKLDTTRDLYREKLSALVDEAQINSLTVLTMEVPCCAGLVHLAKSAVDQATRKVHIISKIVGIQGQVLSEQWV